MAEKHVWEGKRDEDSLLIEVDEDDISRIRITLKDMLDSARLFSDGTNYRITVEVLDND